MGITTLGIIGCGNISGIYLKNCGTKYPNLKIKAVADLLTERAEEQANIYSVPEVMSPEALIQDPDIQIIVNLTTPGSHASIAMQALEAGKHVYLEKPLALTRKQGEAMLELASKKNLRIGCAPDTFLGAGGQTCRQLIEDGEIGEVIGGTAYMMGHGHESWHPDPAFYYQLGGGPMFDMGPYYLAALINLLGPVKTLAGATKMGFKERTITSEPKNGQVIKVEVPTHLNAILHFDSGAQCTIATSFDVWRHTHSNIELYGTEGSLRVPDPNTFDGPVWLFKPGMDDWQEIALTHPYAENARGIGIADMAFNIEQNVAHRANGEFALHILDIMEGIHDSSDKKSFYNLVHRCEQPKPFPKQGLEL